MIAPSPPPRTGSPLIEVRGLRVDYGTGPDAVHAVIDADLTLTSGCVLGLAGESGSGKSTLAYALTRLLRAPGVITGGGVLLHTGPAHAGPAHAGPAHTRPAHTRPAHTRPAPTSTSPPATSPAAPTDSDRVIDLLAASERELRGLRWSAIAVVMQSAMHALNPVISVGAQLGDVLKAHRQTMDAHARRQRAADLLEAVGISGSCLGNYPHQLSGGMRQRVMIAMALALDPAVVIMDEPTTALDVVTQREILAELARLQRELGFAVLFITHDLSLLVELANSIAVMYAGRLVEQAAAANLRSAPRHPYTLGLLHSFPPLHGPRRQLTGIPGSPPDPRFPPPKCPFHPRCPFAMDICRAATPPVIRLGSHDERSAACWLHDGEHRLPPDLSQPEPGERGAEPGKRGAEPGKRGAEPGERAAKPGKPGAEPEPSGARPARAEPASGEPASGEPAEAAQTQPAGPSGCAQ